MARTSVTRFSAGSNSVRTTAISGDTVNSNDVIRIPGLTISPNSNWTLVKLINPVGDGSYFNMTFYSQADGTGVGRSWMTSPLVGRFWTSALGGMTRNSNQLPILNSWQWVVYTNTYNSGANTNDLNMYFMPLRAAFAISIGSFLGIAAYEEANGEHHIGANKLTPAGFGADAYFGHFQFFSRTLTQAEVSQRCTRNSFSRSNLECEYLFTESSGSTVKDTSGNGRDGILVDGAAFSLVSPFPARAIVATRTPVLSRVVV